VFAILEIATVVGVLLIELLVNTDSVVGESLLLLETSLTELKVTLVTTGVIVPTTVAPDVPSAPVYSSRTAKSFEPNVVGTVKVYGSRPVTSPGAGVWVAIVKRG